MLEELKKLCQNVKEDFLQLFLNRLNSFKIEPTIEMLFSMAFAINKAVNHCYNDCNISELPTGLYEIVCDMAVASFILQENSINNLNIDDLDLTPALSSISEGDVSVSFKNQSGASLIETLQAMANGSIYNRGNDFACYRKIKW